MVGAKNFRHTLQLFSVGTLLLGLPFFCGVSLAQEQESVPESAPSQEDTYQYNPTGKRDPFYSPLYRVTEQAAVTSDEGKTPLQRLDLGQFKVVGIILETGEPRALIEDNSGLGYIVTPGTLIGPRGGMIKAIQPDRILVEEYEVDFYGKRQALEKEMPLTVAETATDNPNRGK